jgi:hypothetical protein
MDILALYSLVRPDGQDCDVLLNEKSDSSRAVYASSTQALLAFSFNVKVPGIFGSDMIAKHGFPFTAIDNYDKWVSMGIKQGLRDQAEESVTALESSLSKQMMVHLAHKGNARRIFLTLLTESLQQMLKLHRMMDNQFLRYLTVLGAECEEGNWILCCQFSEALFAGTSCVRKIGSDAFSDSGHVKCVMYLWAALQTHRFLQGYIELDFVDHPEVSYVVVEHLIRTRVPMANQAGVVGKLESKMGQQTESILKLQQDMRIALKK